MRLPFLITALLLSFAAAAAQKTAPDPYAPTPYVKLTHPDGCTPQS